MLVSDKEIAEFIKGKTRVHMSEASVRAARRRAVDPLPWSPFNGRVTADPTEVEAWAVRQLGRSKHTGKAAKTA